jgi:hypothetical protein
MKLEKSISDAASSSQCEQQIIYTGNIASELSLNPEGADRPKQ